jgi:peptide/nickel transport system ATP-binding protein
MPAEPAPNGPVIAVDDLTVRFVRRAGALSAVNGVSFALHPGEVMTILGESGSGKSVTLKAMMRLLQAGKSQITGGVVIDGNDMLGLDDGKLADVRGTAVSMIFQEPMLAFDPVFTIGQQITETITRHEPVTQAAALQRALDLLELVQIPSAKRRLDAYPHELSGGMRQRAMIALALSCRPSLLLADEPTTALDATVQIQILLLLRQLQRELGMAVIFVTHDVGVAVEIADRVAVMYAGRFVETGPLAAVIHQRRHPYTAGLLASTVHGAMRGRRLETIPGAPPNLANPIAGCAFAPRCRHVAEACRAADIPEFWPAPDHMARCLRLAPTPLAAE